MIEHEGYTEWKLLRIWQPSPWIIENWLNGHSQRGTKWRSFYGCMCRKDSPYSAESVNLKGRTNAYLMSLSSSQFLKEWQRRERTVVFFFAELWPSGYYKYRWLEIITTSFLLSCRSWHAEIWACGLVSGSPAGALWVLLYKEISSQNSTAYIQPKLMTCG